MNKYLFWVLTLVVSLILCVMVYYTGNSYLTSEQYVPLPKESIPQDGEYLELDEFFEGIENIQTEEEANDLMEKMPIEMRIVQAKAFLVVIFCMIMSMALILFVAFVIKDSKIDFSVLPLDSSDKKINVVRISLYIVLLMVAFTSSTKYPPAFLPGWGLAVLWLGYIFMIIVWILNILYAFKERKQQKKLGRV
jgi:hypothetical protein